MHCPPSLAWVGHVAHGVPQGRKPRIRDGQAAPAPRGLNCLLWAVFGAAGGMTAPVPAGHGHGPFPPPLSWKVLDKDLVVPILANQMRRSVWGMGQS